MKTHTPTTQKILMLPLAASLLLSANHLFAATTFTGAVDNTWEDAGNWSAGLPDAADDTSFDTAATLTSTASIRRLLLSGASDILTINAGGDLTGNSSVGLINDGASLVVNSGGSYTRDGTLDIRDQDGVTGGGIIINDGGVFDVKSLRAADGTLAINGSTADVTFFTLKTVDPNTNDGNNNTFTSNNANLTLNGATLNVTGNMQWDGASAILVGNGSTLNFAGSTTHVLSDGLDTAAGGVVKFSGSGDQTLADVISGGGSFEQSGTGTTTLSGTNTYSGATTVSAGILKVDNEDALGTTAGATTVASGATLQLSHGNANPGFEENITINGTGAGGIGAINSVDGTNRISGDITLGSDSTIQVDTRLNVGGIISDGGSGFTLTKTGGQLFSHGGTASYSHLDIQAGEYLVSGGNALPGGAGTSVTVQSGAKLTIWANQTISNSPNIILEDGSTYTAARSAADSSSINGTILLNGGSLTMNNARMDHTINSDITGTGTLTLVSTQNEGEKFTFAGNNSYSATTIIGDGTAGTGSMRLYAGSTTGLSNNSDFQVSAESVLVLDGNSNTIGSLGDFSGAGGIVQNANASAATLTVGDNDNNTTFSGIIRDGGAGALSLTKIGTGTQTLSGANTYTGDTTVSGGTLSLASTYTHTGTGDFIVNGGTLKVADDVDISSSAMMTISLGGVISPGNSPGTAITGAQTWSDGGTYLWEINASDDAGGTIGTDPGWDWLDITGALDLTNLSAGGFTIDIDSLTAGNIAGDAVGFDTWTKGSPGDVDYSFTIATASSGISGFDAANFTLDSSGFSNAPSWEWGIILSGNSLVLEAYAVPEPSSTALLGLGGLALMLRRKRS